ncbi:hypothetical protein CO2235_150199 [Cupriavidus oxalaticus]|uniref:Uncharacterized protein n=1 Tax=Cupriavidus oxalaticus TaxID=96344 RepID=A0A375FZL5_9BURK|nr:hypothetical protein CO2235_U590050 [Cupriavidus oxalaticus]SPC12544.1 hypothetical protein CO2235_150199 [Cupriavidus oxalaticus]
MIWIHLGKIGKDENATGPAKQRRPAPRPRAVNQLFTGVLPALQGHCGPQEHALRSAVFWQPQAQLAPGQAVHWQGDWVVGYMAMLLSVGNESPVCRPGLRAA